MKILQVLQKIKKKFTHSKCAQCKNERHNSEIVDWSDPRICFPCFNNNFQIELNRLVAIEKEQKDLKFKEKEEKARKEKEEQKALIREVMREVMRDYERNRADDELWKKKAQE